MTPVFLAILKLGRAAVAPVGRRRRAGPACPSLSSVRAFTLVEVIVAATITAMVAGFMAVIVRNVSIVWSRTSNRLGTDAQARLVLDQLQLDLQGAVYRDDASVWIAADVLHSANGNATGLWQIAARNPKPTTNLSEQMSTPKLSDARFGTARIWLRFFTTSRGVNSAANLGTVSAPVAVSYQIIRRFTATNPANQNTAYLLHRSESRPAMVSGRLGALEAGFNITSANYTTSSSATNSGAITGDPRGVLVPGNARNLDAVVTDNVIDFGVRAYVRDLSVPGGLRLLFPATSTGALANATTARLRGSLPPETPVNQWGTGQPFPDVVDIMVRILTEEGAQLIATIEKVQNPALVVPAKYNSNAQEWWWAIAQENSRVYTRRVVINAKSL